MSIRDGRIAAIGADDHRRRTIASSTRAAATCCPVSIQTHVHLCQTLFRGYADDLPLMDWLRTRVWPMEAAHTPGIAARRGAPGDDRAALRAARPRC